uniref:Uncharacterized protein n=1 Tax=Neogobius melanostomus TaxID=47308 RepID=A0A8C6UYC8_9GOBI
MLDSGVAVNQRDSADGRTLLRRETDVGVRMTEHGRTALRAAAWGGHEEIVHTLLEYGASVDRADGNGRTPLIAAAYMGHQETVEILLDRDAQVNFADRDGRTALSVAKDIISPSRYTFSPHSAFPDDSLFTISTKDPQLNLKQAIKLQFEGPTSAALYKRETPL